MVILFIVAGAVLSFLGKTVGFVAEHTWALIVLLQDLLMYGGCKELKRVMSWPVLFLSSLLCTCLDLTFFSTLLRYLVSCVETNDNLQPS